MLNKHYGLIENVLWSGNKDCREPVMQRNIIIAYKSNQDEIEIFFFHYEQSAMKCYKLNQDKIRITEIEKPLFIYHQYFSANITRDDIRRKISVKFQVKETVGRAKWSPLFGIRPNFRLSFFPKIFLRFINLRAGRIMQQRRQRQFWQFERIAASLCPI